MKMADLAGKADVVFITFDTLRFDVAQQAYAEGSTPNLSRYLPATGWEKRHSPGSFTYAAHHAFFAGFLPTPAHPGRHERLFAARFAGSETTGSGTLVFDTPDIVTGFAGLGYHTICIGGVGFFNLLTPLSRVLPSLFKERHWSPALGVTDLGSTGNQFRLAAQRLRSLPPEQRFFLFINLSAIHQPNRHYLPGAEKDGPATQLAALQYVDGQFPILWEALRERGQPSFHIYCSDHGTAYGDDGYWGHRLAHPVVWEVPYAEFLMG